MNNLTVMKRILPALLIAFCLWLQGCNKTPPANVAATVNGRPITYANLDKQFELQFSTAAGARPADDQTMIQKLEVLRSLIDNEIMLQRAEKLSLMAVDADVEAKYNELKAPYTQEEFQRQLKARKMTAEDLKAQLRRDLSVQKLINKEITSHINISDQDVRDFYAANKSSFNLVEPQVHIAQIVVTPTPDPNVKNLKNDKAQNDDQAKKKIQLLEARLSQGEDFSVLAQALSEDPNTAANGGDLGFIPESSLEKANPELRKMVMTMQPGQVSRPIRTPEGYRLLKLITKEPAGQRELNDPRVQQSIRENLMNRKDQLLKAAYFEVARNEAQVVNQYALSITQSKDAKK
ncbi:MAG TPA: peptidylprolyl isomerase [Bryobacteraceae bacterium]|nr:peptidylprolyl isomerase [Bryobacteraceae bacterium]